MLKLRTLITACGMAGAILFGNPTWAKEPLTWSTGKITEAKASEISNPIAAAFLDALVAYGRNHSEAMSVEAVFDAVERAYGRCAAVVPVNAATDKVFIQFSPFATQHDGPEKFHECEFIEFRNGSNWTHVDLKEGFAGHPKVDLRKATLSNNQNSLGVNYGLYSGLDLFPNVMKLWKHKVSLLSYLQGSTQTFFEIATIVREGHTYLVFRTGGTPEEVIVDPDKGFALVEHTYINDGLKMSTKVLEYQEINRGVWIPKKAEHIFAPKGEVATVIKLEVVDFKILPITELEKSLYYPFPEGWTIKDERIGKTFTIGQPPDSTEPK